ncbi:uncharacterized protein CIMG_03124 [Coccidioides immitis RS]|uniref:Fungal-type protein kinase domain-containing protein n=1 Tax=Coccidioides immitis (strain RS) TaxID=246410 RepID=J3KAP0_COCIM|nr:uncharacterized protein CIMG_03124 [Coccidioides immitis RS]EAS32100.3 hypothetical protein CIMG_03124 [Coccidioides immitis RS]
MANLSQDDRITIKKYPLNNSLDHLQDLLQDTERFYTTHLISDDGALDGLDEACQKTVSRLLSALQGTDAALVLQSRISSGNVASEMARLFERVQKGDFSYTYYRLLVKLVIQKAPDFDIWNAVLSLIATSSQATPPPRPIASLQQTPWLRNTSSFVNSTEYRKHVDTILKEELGDLHADIPGFLEAYFGNISGLDSITRVVLDKCKEGDHPLYNEEKGWRDWPEQAVEKEVLKWLADVIRELVHFVETHDSAQKIDRRPLAQPTRPLEGSIATRKLDIGFVNDPSATEDSRCHWSEILVPGELKNDPKYDSLSRAWLDLGRYAREVLAAQDSRRFVLGFTLCGPFLRLWEFDRLGGIASESFDINTDGLQFISIILGFLLMSPEQLGFDPTIITIGGQRYIEVEKDGEKERLVIDGVIGRARCIAGRATTCWKVHHKDDPQTLLVVKDSWQYPERDEEGELLREATESGVTNVARYYHHGTIRINNKNDDVLSIRRDLSIPTLKSRQGSVKPTTSWNRSRRGRKNQDSASGQKRSSDCVDTLLPPPPSKRTQSSSPTKSPANSTPLNRVHRRVIVRDYGKPIYESSSRVALLAGLEGCIKGYDSLYQNTGMIQCDISPRNLLVNEDDDNPSWPAFLIDLDLAIRVERDGFSGARGKTGTRAFMAIGVLYGEKHSFMHDLESFFWVLFWICIHYDGPGKGRIVENFEEWNYVNTEKLANEKKGVIADEGDFLKIAEENFTPYYQPLGSWVNRLRRVVFPDGRRWKKLNPHLSSEMMDVLRRAQSDSNVIDRGS